jgi:1-acyl-sn-glycerol-3-phosphate acyltransferase
VPVGLVGTDEIQPTDSKLPKFFRTVTVRFGAPIDLTHYEGRADDHLALRQLTDEVMYEIHALSGYEYVDTYATKGADARGSQPDTSPEVVDLPVRVATLAS